MTNLRKSLASTVFLVLAASRASPTTGFVPFCPRTHSPPTRTAAPVVSNAGVGVTVGVTVAALSMIWGGGTNSNNNNNEKGEVGKGDNWLEKSFPVGPGESISPKSIDDYDLGVSGRDFQTGPLSKRMHDAIISGSGMGSGATMTDEIERAFLLYAMDFTAKEATRAALKQNGLQMVLLEEDEDQGMWGDVEDVRLYDVGSETPGSELYDSLEDAVADWTPGQAFDFVVKQVPAKMRELSIDELVTALDPEGKLREEARERGGEDAGEPDEEALLSIIDDGMTSIADMASDNVRRVEEAPRGSTDAERAYKGGDSRGYRVIHRSDLSRDSVNADGTENEKTVLHVMNALVAHGVLLVDLTDGGTSFGDAEIMARVWETADRFFETSSSSSSSSSSSLPGMTTVMETGSQHAMVGYAEYDGGSMKFLETRRERATGRILPEQAWEFLGDDGVAALGSSFDLVAGAGRDVVRIAVAASSEENGAFADPDHSGDEASAETDRRIRASRGAALLAEELVDDGKPLPSGLEIEHSEGRVSMSPFRLCRYTDAREGEETGSSREVFGAHTDSSFVTAVPVAEISGLEVYDEDAEKWYRPELRARAHWEEEQRSLGRDPSLLHDDIGDGKRIPWHARYLAIMPGENLQLATRNEIPAAIHRVVAVKGERARVSAPMLLRGRPGTKFLTERYIGGWLGNQLILDADGLSMEEIHEKNQPQSFQ